MEKETPAELPNKLLSEKLEEQSVALARMKRELEIEAALEKVRARAMSMQHSEELKELIGTVFTELTRLDLQLTRCTIMIFDSETNDSRWWMVNIEVPSQPMSFLVKYHELPPYQSFFTAWKERSLKWEYDLCGKDKEDWDAFLFSETELSLLPDFVIAGMKEPERVLLTGSFNNFGCLNTASLEPLSDEHYKIMLRFAKVFDLTYTRFNDLQKAEAQTREAEIQLALERIRAKTMAMQRSDELLETSALFFEQVKELGVTTIQNSIAIVNEEAGYVELSSTVYGNHLPHTLHVPIDDPYVMAKGVAAWKEKRRSMTIEIGGQELKDYNERRNSFFEKKVNFPEDHWIVNISFFSKGWLSFSSNKKVPDEMVVLMNRFAVVFEQTYTRFQDLKDAEVRTQIAIKEASLDRVRGEIASMRTAEDLQRITPLVWRELTALGVPFFRCGVFIVDDEKQKIHFYLSTPDGKPLTALELGFDGADVTKNATAHWREQKVYVSHWSKEEFQQFAQDLISQGQIQNANTYQGGDEAPQSLTLQFVPFAQGMMYVGSAEDLSITQIELVQSLADAFSTAYARYEDFNRLELAKQQIESALKDLRATQTQLIQSEKMASLGELTAGIAHEIQNPLNFVNNFSEVSTELVDEMNEEIQKGNLEDAKQIASDLKDNLSKINHHGKRAGDIVKGMLQHSRSSSGVKEPTDINALADEYLRLAYHGLRAKDKSFNATMITDYDASIGMIDVIPQDMGRVILNLITNAFYASSAKALASADKFEPTIWLSTKKSDHTVFINVKDNGTGIPQKIIDKIFQPFFTTKPTGQGTGLGLSLSYDIVKAHGGELKVETKENEGTTFIIQLPF